MSCHRNNLHYFLLGFGACLSATLWKRVWKDSSGIFRIGPKWYKKESFQWRHNGRDSVSNHHPHDCLLNRLFRRRSKKTSKLRVTGLCAGNSSINSAQMASNTENVSIWWRHHVGSNLTVFVITVRSQDFIFIFYVSLLSRWCGWCFSKLFCT